MPYVFRPHQSGDSQIVAWDRSNIIDDNQINSIPDAVERGHADKIGTSIPSPFARLYLFETAFKIIVANQSFVGSSMYHQLVSDCLDVFHLLYLLGDDEKLSFRKWERNEQIATLKQSKAGHKALGAALDIFFEERRMKDLKEIYLIYYNGHLIGGTSPVTGLFTSPNWFKLCERNKYVFKTPGESGDILFDDEPCPIQQREEGFIAYMYAWIYAHQDYWSEQSSAFFKYFTQARLRYEFLDAKLAKLGINTSTDDDFLKSKYQSISVDVGSGRTDELYTGPCKLYQPTTEETSKIALDSDFVIAPTVNFYQTFRDATGQERKLHRPLVLTEGNHRMKYLKDVWSDNTVVDDEPKKPPMHRRKLPGFSSITYPWLTTGDFLTTELIRLPFVVDSKFFYTGFEGDWHYLLPIRRNYFQYFTIEDLNKQLTIVKSESGKIDVSLNIPVVSGTMVLKRSYREGTDSVVELGEINVGVFPFYQLADLEKANDYVIGLATSIRDKIDLRAFYSSRDGADSALEMVDTTRSETKYGLLTQTVYHEINGSFDVLEILAGSSVLPYTGVIVPKMESIEHDLLDENCSYAVDFGTTNTHIMWKKGKGGDAKDLERKKPQMVMLSNTISYAEARENVTKENVYADTFNEAKILFDREFVPNFLGEKSDYSFPTRTVLCEAKTYKEGNPRLFGNINIAFDFLTRNTVDRMEMLRDNYLTDIKWSFEKQGKGKAKEHITAFFEELLLLIRHHAIEHGVKPQTCTVHWMVPDSMRSSQRDDFELAWTDAVRKVFRHFPDKPTLKQQSESVVPYYAIPNMKVGQSRINFDIGGGTTDVLVALPKKDKYFSLSAKFAGNDIWGDSPLQERNKTKDNGFLELFEKYRYPEIVQSEIVNTDGFKIYDDIRSVSDGLDSSDLISLLFKYDEDLGLSSEIRSSPQLKALLLIHVAALVFQVVKVMEERGVDMPEVFSFTGMGSKYLRIIAGSEKSWLKIIRTLVTVFLNEESSQRIKRISLEESPKKMTATGALMVNEKDAREIEEALEKLNYMGFSSNEDFDAFDAITVGQLPEVEPLLKVEFERFIKAMGSKEMKALGKDNEFNLQQNGYDILKRLSIIGQEGFETLAYIEGRKYNSSEEIEDMPFFWFVKGAFYDLSKEIIDQLVR